MQLPGLGESEAGSPVAPSDHAKRSLVQELDGADDGCAESSDSEMPELVPADSGADAGALVLTPPKPPYNEELFQSPEAGNSGFTSEVMEMCIALMQWLANHEPSILKTLA